jgi:predicted small secreted protein
LLWRSNLLWILYLVAGVVVAADRNYLSGIGDIQAVAEALLAVVLWPLVLLGVSMRF